MTEEHTTLPEPQEPGAQSDSMSEDQAQRLADQIWALHEEFVEKIRARQRDGRLE